MRSLGDVPQVPRSLRRRELQVSRKSDGDVEKPLEDLGKRCCRLDVTSK